MANDFLPFGGAGGANVISQAAYNALATRLSGYIAGIAKSNELNKTWRQSAAMTAALGEFIQDYGALDALDDGDIDKLEREFVRSLQASKFSFVVATGTANAWTVAPNPTVAAYAAGRVLNIIAPATNTSTTVNMAISGLANRRIKKQDGNDPAVGDLVSGKIYQTIDDGTNIRVISALPSDVVVATLLAARTQVFTSSGTFTVPAYVTSVEVEVWGGGGAGGASGDGSGGGVAGNSGAGGGGGGYGYKQVTGLTPGAAETVTVGAGGAPGTGSSGGSGGTSSFGAHVSCTGGVGGARGTSSSADGGAGGAATGADVAVSGGQGGSSGTNTTATPTQSQILSIYNKGGMAAGGLSTVQLGGTGGAGSGKGSGGSGASGGSFLVGGAGATGLVIVRW